MNTIQTKKKMMESVSVDSLFISGGTVTAGELNTLPVHRYDMGKYTPSGRGNETEASIPIWYVTRSDRHGSYIALYCFAEHMMDDNQKEVYARAVTVWRSRK